MSSVLAVLVYIIGPCVACFAVVEISDRVDDFIERKRHVHNQ